MYWVVDWRYVGGFSLVSKTVASEDTWYSETLIRRVHHSAYRNEGSDKQPTTL